MRNIDDLHFLMTILIVLLSQAIGSLGLSNLSTATFESSQKVIILSSALARAHRLGIPQ